MKKIILMALVFALAMTIAVPTTAMAHSGISTMLTMTVEQTGDNTFELTILEYNDSPYWKDDPDLHDVWIDLQPLGYTLIKGDGYYVGGDLDDDGLLDGAHTQTDVGETWEWVVPVTVTTPTTFVAIGHGITYDGWDITYDPDAAWPWPNGLIAHDAEERAEVTVDVSQFFNICGYKFLAGTEEGLLGWQINLYEWDDSLEPADWTLIATASTDENGKYCFSNLEDGDYKVTETFKEGWVQVSPAGNEHLVTLPGGASDCEIGPFYNFENEQEGNGEGFTPGFWRNHDEAWPATGFAPSDIFSAVFGVGPSDTLGEYKVGTIWAKGGGENVLLRHGTAALLNAAHPNVDYAYTVAEVIAMVQDAYATGDYDTAADAFIAENELEGDITS